LRDFIEQFGLDHCLILVVPSSAFFTDSELAARRTRELQSTGVSMFLGNYTGSFDSHEIITSHSFAGVTVSAKTSNYRESTKRYVSLSLESILEQGQHVFMREPVMPEIAQVEGSFLWIEKAETRNLLDEREADALMREFNTQNETRTNSPRGAV